jgi:cell wall-associated NlpC family hydrolase
MTRPEFDAKILAVAKTWVGAPFLHNGRTRSQGVDCLGLLVCVLRDAGIEGIQDGDGKVYRADWFVHTPEARYLSGLLANGIPVPGGPWLPGDVLYFSTGLLAPGKSEAVTHGGLWLGNGSFLHAVNGHRVAVADIGQRAWAKTFAGAIRLYAVLAALGESPPQPIAER